MASEKPPFDGAKLDEATGAWLMLVDIPVSTKGKDGKVHKGSYKLWLPCRIKDSVAYLGEAECQKRILGSFVVTKSGGQRDRLKRGGDTSATKPRKKAAYLSKLGL